MYIYIYRVDYAYCLILANIWLFGPSDIPFWYLEETSSFDIAGTDRLKEAIFGLTTK